MKHNLFSRFISVLLAVVMLAGLMSMPSLAEAVTGVQSGDAASASSQIDTQSAEGDVDNLEEEDNTEPQEPDAGSEGTVDEDSNAGTQDPAVEGDGTEATQSGDAEGAGQELAEGTESTEAPQSDSEPQDMDNEGTPSESAFDCEAFYDKLMNAQTAEELESLTSGLSDEDIASFQQWLDDDKMADLEEKEAQFSSTDAADDSQPAPAANYDKVAPISAATAAAASATGALKARARTFSLTSDTLSGSTDSGTGDTSNLVLEKKAESVGNNTYKITLDAYTKGIVTAGTAPAYDIVLVLDMSTSMEENFSYTPASEVDRDNIYYVKQGGNYIEVSYCNRCDAWTDGCEGFIFHRGGNKYYPDREQFYVSVSRLDALKTAAETFVSNVAAQPGDNQIAIVGFHNNGNVLAGLQDAGNNALINTIKGIDNNDLQGATEHGKGLEQAKNVFDKAGNTGHKRLVVMITDGEPEPQSSSEWSSRIVKEAVNNAHDLKSASYNAVVYTVSVMPGTNAQGTSAMDRYMSYVSSNYPNAEYTGNTTSSHNEETILSHITPGTPAALDDGESFYLTAGDVETLNSIFDQIGDQIETPSISLDENTVIQDAVTQYFNMPAAGDVTVQKIPYNGSAFEDNRAQTITNDVTVHIEGNKVQVDGFDFDENFVTEKPKSDESYGYKLRITFNVTPKGKFWGGNQVPTNVPDDSGVYTGTGTLVKNFDDEPIVDVPLKEIELTAKDLNIYYGNEAPSAEDLVNDIGMPHDWRTDYVNDITFTANADISNTKDGTYSVTATLSPKYNGTEDAETSAPVTANVKVFTPTVTWKDTTLEANANVNNTFPDNKDPVVWKHFGSDDVVTDAEDVTMTGSAPELTFTFELADNSSIPQTITSDLHVKVTSVTINGIPATDVTKHDWTDNKLNSAGCTSTCGNPKDEGYQFRVHVGSCELVITKTITGLDNLPSGKLSEYASGLTFTYTNNADSTDTGSITLAQMVYNEETHQYTHTFDGLKVGATYTISEAGYTVQDYDFTGTTEKEITTTAGENQVAFDNEYTWNPKGKLTVSKTLNNFNSTMGKDAIFQFEVTAGNESAYAGQVWHVNITFNAKGTATADLTGLPVGTYTVKELDSAGYTLVGDSEPQTITINPDGTSSGVASFTNDKAGDNTPGDQDIVRNNFTYDSTTGVWKFTQEHN